MKAGLHFDVPMTDYIADPAPEPSLSKGIVKDLVTTTPRHAWHNHPRLNPDYKPSDSSRADMGSAVHSLILGGQSLAIYDGPDWRKKAAREFKEEARANGQIPVLADQEVALTSAAAAAMMALGTLPGWGETQFEGTMIWEDAGTWKRGRFDIWCPSANLMIDIKTCGSAEPDGWIRSSLRAGGYDVQAELYLEGLRTLGIANEHTDLLFLLVEITPPFCCSFVGLDPAYADFAKRKIRMATQLWRECLAADKWPGYPVIPHWAEPAAWDEGALSDKAMMLEASRENTKEETHGLFV